MKKSFLKRFSRWIGFGMVALLIVFLIVTSVSQISGYKTVLEEKSSERAMALLKEDVNEVVDVLTYISDEARSIADDLSGIVGERNTFYFLEDLSTPQEEGSEDRVYIKTVRCFKDETIYTSLGQVYMREVDEVKALIGSKSSALIGYVYDASTNMKLLAYYVPVLGNDYLDGVVLFYSLEVLDILDEANLNAVASSTLLLTKGGTIASCLYGEYIDSTATELITYLRTTSLEESSISQISSVVSSAKEGTYAYTSQGVKYIFAMTHVGGDTSNLFLGSFYETNLLYESEYGFVNTSSGLIVLFSAGILILFGVMFGRFIYQNYYEKHDYLDPVYHCPTRVTFLTRAQEILGQNKKTKFAVIAGRIIFFKFITEMDGKPSKKYIISIGHLISKLIGNYETYCYDMDGRFFIMMHYNEFDEVLTRIKQINTIAGKVKIDKDKQLQLGYGLVKTEDIPDAPIMKFIDHAMDSLRHTEAQIGLSNYTVFNPNKYEECMDKDFIEMHMNQVLEEGNFKVFYQPKYNMVYNQMDGSEALVRWYMPDEKRYYPPATFLPVIENNGFIVKVDHYVFEEVCIYIRDSLNNGRKVYPVSVNVSRMTVEQSDFVNFYVNIKKKYKIRDGLLCIEFTESANFEDYENMSKSVEMLHQAGFLCSIDDFGSGYSSYNCLKTLHMDEIKLDRFFLNIGSSGTRDEDVLRSIIALGKKLGMKVTQEGVSSQEDYERIKEYGCEIMQGYLYAKPMPLEDYISFTTNEMRGRFE